MVFDASIAAAGDRVRVAADGDKLLTRASGSRSQIYLTGKSLADLRNPLSTPSRKNISLNLSGKSPL
jgi:hypothetical protein